MFKNPGKVLKIVAIILAIMGVIGAIFVAVELGKANGSLGFLYFLLVVFGSFVLSLILYCFGEMTEKLDEISEEIYCMQSKQYQIFQKETNIEKVINNINKVISEKKSTI